MDTDEQKTKKMPNGCAVLIVFAIIVYLLIALGMHLCGEKKTLGAITGDTAITLDGYFASPSKEEIEQLISLVRDKVAANKYVSQSQSLILLKAGIKVYVTDYSHGLIRIRQEGQLQEYWTVQEAVQKANIK